MKQRERHLGSRRRLVCGPTWAPVLCCWRVTRPLRPEGTSKHEFKIGQSLIYRKGRTKADGRYVVLAVLSRTRGEVRYRIRSQDDEALEFIACESELGTS
jgi:hypothetical protein